MLVALYRKCISPNLRAFIYKLFLGDFLVIIRNPKHWIKHKWYKIYYSIVTPKTEKEQAYKAWSKTRSCLTPGLISLFLFCFRSNYTIINLIPFMLYPMFRVTNYD